VTGLSGLDRIRSEVGRRLGVPWSHVQDQPPRPEPLGAFRLFGLVTAWMEGDVIAATVANAFNQGCESVFLLDNDSPDDTVAQAQGAGAELAASYQTTRFDDDRRIALVNQVVGEISATTGDDHVWWLLMDADEFCHGPRGGTVRDHLAGLDRRFRCVGARVLHHLPSSRPANIGGFHPLDFQPLCAEIPVGFCKLGHWKHPLMRWDRRGARVETIVGYHQLTGPACPVREPGDGVVLHHFPFREEAPTRRRLGALCAPDARGVVRVPDPVQGMVIRWRTMDAVYQRRWDEVGIISDRTVGVRPRRWTSVLAPVDQQVGRWYSPEDLDAAVVAWHAGPGVR